MSQGLALWLCVMLSLRYNNRADEGDTMAHRPDLDSQSACDCGARPGRNHSADCQYIMDLVEHVVEKGLKKLEN